MKNVHYAFFLFFLFTIPSAITGQTSKRGLTYGDTLYIVHEGDSLGSIALRLYNDSSKWKELWEANPFLRNPHCIYPRQVLHLIDVAEKKDETESLVGKSRTMEIMKLAMAEDGIVENSADSSGLNKGIESLPSMKSSALEMLVSSLLNDQKSSDEKEQKGIIDEAPGDTVHLPVLSLIFTTPTDSQASMKYLIGDSEAFIIQGDFLQKTNERPPVSANCELTRTVTKLIELHGKFLKGKRLENEWLVYTKWIVLKDDMRYYAFIFTNVNEKSKSYSILKEPIDILRIRIFSDEGYMFLTDKGLQGTPGYFYAADSQGEPIRINLDDPIIHDKYMKALQLFIEGVNLHQNINSDPTARKKLNRIM